MGSIGSKLGQAGIVAVQTYLIELNNLSSRVVDPGFAGLPLESRTQLARNRQKRVRYQECYPETVCAVCGADKKLERHHIVPPRFGGTNVRENIAWLCHSHHVEHHGGE